MTLDICANCKHGIEYVHLFERWARTDGNPADPWVCINSPLTASIAQHVPSMSVG